ncbi:MAG: RusA family crossover junction endodeoxyribonuclease [Nitrospirae bacterium]|nr:RusA family crossover junction endodeoxyribonuclease [Nitrospirota bacterium]MDA1303933.1 RusA family crossover junction endodeoxyribonuclease [Nitrospirota bacterium]
MAAPSSHRSPFPNTRQNKKRSPVSASTTQFVRLTTTQFEFVLPLPPSINSQYATVNGRRVLSSTGRHYKASIGQILLGALAQSSDRTVFLDAAQSHYLALSLHFYFPTLLRRDLDGGLKIAQDALCEAMGINDNRIVEIHLFKALDREGPRLHCTLSITTPAPPMSLRGKRSSPSSNRRIRL